MSSYGGGKYFILIVVLIASTRLADCNLVLSWVCLFIFAYIYIDKMRRFLKKGFSKYKITIVSQRFEGETASLAKLVVFVKNSQGLPRN